MVKLAVRPSEPPEYLTLLDVAVFSPIFATIEPAPALLLVLYVATIFVTLVKETGEVPLAPETDVVTWMPSLENPAPSLPLVQFALASLQVAVHDLEVNLYVVVTLSAHAILVPAINTHSRSIDLSNNFFFILVYF